MTPAQLAAARKNAGAKPRPQRNEAIIALSDQGLTYGQIAARLRISRCVVAGVMWRAGGVIKAAERVAA